MEKLLEVLSIQSVSHDQFRMFAYIIRQVSQIPNAKYWVVDGNIYIEKGYADEYPCMVAHMDTVHDIVEDLHPIEFNGMITGFNRVKMEQTGIGGDDKVGIYIALECLREFDNIKVAFFRDEEVGCLGSYVADMGFFADCKFVLQCDRKGNDDFVINASGVELSSKTFQDDVLPIVKGYGYKFAHGMMTDVMALKENGIRCSVANMSCGYYRPHSADEYVVIDDVMECLQMCKTIIFCCTGNYKHKAKPRYTAPASAYGKYKKGTGYWDWSTPKSSSSIWDEEAETKVKETYCMDCWSAEAKANGLCDHCNEWYKGNEILF